MKVEEISLQNISDFFRIGGKVENISKIYPEIQIWNFCKNISCTQGIVPCPFNDICWYENRGNTKRILKQIQLKVIEILQENPNLIFCL